MKKILLCLVMILLVAGSVFSAVQPYTQEDNDKGGGKITLKPYSTVKDVVENKEVENTVSKSSLGHIPELTRDKAITKSTRFNGDKFKVRGKIYYIEYLGKNLLGNDLLVIHDERTRKDSTFEMKVMTNNDPKNNFFYLDDCMIPYNILGISNGKGFILLEKIKC